MAAILRAPNQPITHLNESDAIDIMLLPDKAQIPVIHTKKKKGNTGSGDQGAL
jgi:hypothetical protein